MIRSKAEKLRRRSPQGRLYLLWMLLLLAFLVFPFLTDHGITGTTCRFHELTGLSCPTCGMSRSLYAFVHLQIGEAFRMHLLGPVLYVITFGVFLKLSGEYISGKKIIIRTGQKFLPGFFLVLFIIWIVYWLVRMTVEYLQR